MVYQIPSWPTLEGQNYAEKLNNLTGSQFNEVKKKSYLLIDEAQVTYSDYDLWNEFFKFGIFHTGFRAVIFCSYGSASSTINDYENGSPLKAGEEQRMQLLPTPSFRYGLLLNREEFNILIEKWRGGSERLYLAEDVQEIIFHWTGGHVAAAKFFFDSIRNKVDT
jgi:hypothetical protein